MFSTRLSATPHRRPMSAMLLLLSECSVLTADAQRPWHTVRSKDEFVDEFHFSGFGAGFVMK